MLLVVILIFFCFHSINDSGWIMLKGMIGIILMVVFMGSCLGRLMVDSPYFICLPILMKVVTLVVVFFGSWLGYAISKFSLSDSVYYLLVDHFFLVLCGMYLMFRFNLWG